jgi:hypothetical protein
VRDAAWARSPIDHFLLARLEEKGLAPAPDAEKPALIRRATFDLTGLPPAPAEVEAFLADDSPGAFAKVVDRLLASPAFGERWARHWLDLARYAETRGHESDYPAPNAWQYRDYVIRALNADVPYDKFVTEHLAGDLVEEPRVDPATGLDESILGTGFWFLGEQVHSPVDIRLDQADRFDNMIDVFGKTFLGLTLACARCHDHKFDAISAKDYYASMGMLEGASYRLARLDDRTRNRPIAARWAQWRAENRAPLGKAIADALRPAADKLAAQGPEAAKPSPDAADLWDIALRAMSKPGEVPAIREALAKRAAEAGSALDGAEVVADFGKMAGDAWRADGVAFGDGPAKLGEVRLIGPPDRPRARMVARDAAEADPFWDGRPLSPTAEADPGSLGTAVRAGRTIKTPDFDLKAGKLYYWARGSGLAYVSIGGHVMIAGPLHGSLVKAIPASPGYRWVEHDLTAYKGQRCHLEFTAGEGGDFAIALAVQADRAPAPLDGPNPLLIRTLAEHAGDSPEGLAAAFRALALGTLDRLADPEALAADPDAAAWASAIDAMLARPDLFGDPAAALAPIAATAKPLRDSIPKEPGRVAPALWEGDPVAERVFLRGSPKTLGDEVPSRFLEALAGPSPAPGGRSGWAAQIVDPQADPLLPRVIVNRVWLHLFGRGIAPTPDNLGKMGEAPSHPELLDRLAVDFVEDGWSIKRLIRTLMLSRAYAMSSRAAGPDAEQADPDNRLWHRMPLRRLDAEAIRDAILAVSGRLDGQMYGPPIPIHLTEFQGGRGRPGGNGPVDGAGRRSIYLAVRRNFLSPLLLAFDAPTPSSTIGRRPISNVPAQALALLNDPFAHDQARIWGERALASPGASPERIERMYLAAYARKPSAAERAACDRFLAGREGEAGAWADLAHALFNAKEFVFLP